jgi:hypothetical protein
MQTTDTARAAQVAPSITRRAMLGTLAAGAVALAGVTPAKAERPARPVQRKNVRQVGTRVRPRAVSPLRSELAAIIREADALGLAILKDDFPRTKPVTYFGTFEGRRYLAYDTAVPLEIVLPQLRAGLVEWKEWAKPWSEAEIKAALRSYRGDDPRLRAVSVALKTIEGTARPGELEEVLRFRPEDDRQAAREIIAKAAR